MPSHDELNVSTSRRSSRVLRSCGANLLSILCEIWSDRSASQPAPLVPVGFRKVVFSSGTIHALWTMVGFKNRYFVMEIFLDPNGDASREDPVILTQFNISKAIKDSILLNFGECGLGASLGSFQVKYVNRITKICIIRSSREDHQKIWSAITMVRSIGNCPVLFNLLDLSGTIRACKTAALKCDHAKFEQYKLMAGDSLTDGIVQECNNHFEKIKTLEN